MPTPKPPCAAAFRQQMVELAHAASSSRFSRSAAIDKGDGLVCRPSQAGRKREDVHVVYELMKANQAELPMRALCKPRAGLAAVATTERNGRRSRKARPTPCCSNRFFRFMWSAMQATTALLR